MMTPIVVSLAMLSPWMTPTERDAFVSALLYGRVTVCATVDARDLIATAGQPRIAAGGRVWTRAVPGVAWTPIQSVDDLDAYWRDRTFAAVTAWLDTHDFNGDGFVDGDDIQLFVAAGATR